MSAHTTKAGHHFSQVRWPGVERWRTQVWVKRLNKVLHKLRLPLTVGRPFDHREDMVSLEQAANLHLLVNTVLHDGVPGDLVELGCYTGNTTAVIASVLHAAHAERPFHVYDSFAHELGSQRNIRDRFERNFAALHLPLPVMHAGDMRATVPDELPPTISFAHIDLGVGGDQGEHAAMIAHALRSIYPRLPRGGVVVFMDYHIPGITVAGNDSNPGVRIATDAFLADKPEKVNTLYGGPCSHGYFRKA